MLLLLACTGTPDAPDSAEDTDPGGHTGTDTELLSSEWERVGEGFGVMTTVAGKGDIGTKGANGWQSSYEGGDPLDAELSRPHMTMADDSGVLYIADKDAHAVRKIEGGAIITIAGTGQAGDDGDGVGTELRLSSPNGLWVRGDGTVYIHDMGNKKVRKLTPDGQLSTLFELPSSGTGRGLWVSDDEDLAYISCGSTLRRWTPDEGVSTYATGFSSLGNVALDPDGLVVATDRGGHSVTRIEADGSKTLIAGNGTTQGGGDGEAALDTGLAEVRGIWFHPEGGYFLATHDGGQLGYVDTDGLWHVMLDGNNDPNTHGGEDEHWSTEGLKISEPRAITMDRRGNLILTENDRGFIRVIEALH